MRVGSFRMQAVMVSLKGFPAAVRQSKKAWIAGFHRRAVSVAMYSTQRTSQRQPRRYRCPRRLPLSSLNGAMPASAVIRPRLSCPSPGRRAHRVKIVTFPTPGTASSRSLFSFQASLFLSRSSRSPSKRTMRSSSQLMGS